MSFARMTTDDVNGVIRTYVGDGDFTDDELKTFGSRGVVHITGLQKLLNHVVMNGFKHHTAVTIGKTAQVLEDAFGNYFGWEVYHHR